MAKVSIAGAKQHDLRSDWRQVFDAERELPDVNMCLEYAEHPHGATGHGRMMIVAQMAILLDRYQKALRKCQKTYMP